MMGQMPDVLDLYQSQIGILFGRGKGGVDSRDPISRQDYAISRDKCFFPVWDFSEIHFGILQIP